MSNLQTEQHVQEIVTILARSEKPVTIAALRKSAGSKGFDEALKQALDAGSIYEHPKVRSRVFWREPWRPEPRIVELCGKKPLSLSELGKQAQIKKLPKKQLDDAVRGLMAEGDLVPVHAFRSSSLKRGTRFATPAVCRQILRRTIQELMDYYSGVGVKAEVAPQPTVKASDVADEESVTASLRALEAREAVAVVIAEVWRKSGLPKDRFDRAVLDLYRKGVVVLHRHDAPFVVSEEQRNELLTDGEGRYYVGISWTYSG